MPRTLKIRHAASFALLLAAAVSPAMAQQSGAAGITSTDTKLFASEMDRAMARMHEGMGGDHEFRIPLETNDPAQPEQDLIVTSNWIA